MSVDYNFIKEYIETPTEPLSNKYDRKEISIELIKDILIKDTITTKPPYIIPIDYRIINLGLITKYYICYDFLRTGYCMKNECKLYHIQELSLISCLQLLHDTGETIPKYDNWIDLKENAELIYQKANEHYISFLLAE